MFSRFLPATASPSTRRPCRDHDDELPPQVVLQAEGECAGPRGGCEGKLQEGGLGWCFRVWLSPSTARPGGLAGPALPKGRVVPRGAHWGRVRAVGGAQCVTGGQQGW